MIAENSKVNNLKKGNIVELLPSFTYFKDGKTYQLKIVEVLDGRKRSVSALHDPELRVNIPRQMEIDAIKIPSDRLVRDQWEKEPHYVVQMVSREDLSRIVAINGLSDQSVRRHVRRRAEAQLELIARSMEDDSFFYELEILAGQTFKITGVSIGPKPEIQIAVSDILSKIDSLIQREIHQDKLSIAYRILNQNESVENGITTSVIEIDFVLHNVPERHQPRLLYEHVPTADTEDLYADMVDKMSNALFKMRVVSDSNGHNCLFNDIWEIHGEHIGTKHKSGYKRVAAFNFRDLLSHILPDQELRRLRIRLYEHFESRGLTGFRLEVLNPSLTYAEESYKILPFADVAETEA